MFEGDKFYTWAVYNSETGKYEGFKESLHFVVDYINNHEPIDGILGFSQGGFLSRIIIKSKEPRFREYKPNNIPQFWILFSSGLLRNPFEELKTKYDIPILHIYGTNDKIIPSYDTSVNKEGEYSIIEHDKGHSIPRLSDEKMNVFIEFIKNQYKQKFGETMPFDQVIDENYKQEYIKKFKEINKNKDSKFFIAKM